MHHTKPIIGITFSDHLRDVESGRRTAETYQQAVEVQSAKTRALTPSGEPVAVAELDGLLLSGGVDVAPAEYGESEHPKLGRVEAGRDRLELELTRRAATLGIPVFGICRGVQVIAVAFGGKLHQDLASCVPQALVHAGAEEPARHRVRVAAGSLLREILGQDALEVNSYHHQAGSVLGDGLRAVAWSEDGVVEAVEGVGEGFVLGVQWHPERMLPDPTQERLFAAFAAAARARAAMR